MAETCERKVSLVEGVNTASEVYCGLCEDNVTFCEAEAQGLENFNAAKALIQARGKNLKIKKPVRYCKIPNCTPDPTPTPKPSPSPEE